MDSKSIETTGGAGGMDRMAGESYPLELARRAIAAQLASDPEPLDDPWFIDEEPVRAAKEDPSYEAWVDQMESWIPPPPSVPARIASQIAALFFL
jgi:hypothetical protein